jgi:hypothetical protein
MNRPSFYSRESQGGTRREIPSGNMTQSRAVASSRAMAMREAYSNGVRCKGFTIAINATTTSSTSIDLSGMGKNFLGFGFYFNGTLPIVTTQLVINNDVVVDSSNLNFFLVNPSVNERDYFPFPRPLNGQDTITFNFTNAGALTTVYLVVYYI